MSIKEIARLVIYLSRQQVAFLEKCRKIKGCGSLKVDFYTRFIPNFSGFGAVTWLEMNIQNLNYRTVEVQI